MRLSGLIITGTDTDVGKTYVSSIILQQLGAKTERVGAYKPVCSGASFNSQGEPVWQDVVDLKTSLPKEFPQDWICPQRYLAAYAPPIAARAEQKRVDDRLLIGGLKIWQGQVDYLVLEGAGGLLSPLSDAHNLADMAEIIRFPLIIVAPNHVGVINHTLLTIEAAKSRGLHVAGVILNTVQPDPETLLETMHAEEIALRTDVPILGIIPYASEMMLQPNGHPATIDWMKLMSRTGQ